MFEFEIVQELEPNDEILEIDYTVRNGKIKYLKSTNLQFIEPRVALYLFNSINFKIKNCKSLGDKEQIYSIIIDIIKKANKKLLIMYHCENTFSKVITCFKLSAG